jgi:signal transduction histidine kinase
MKHDSSKVVEVDIKIRIVDDSNFVVLQLDDRGPGIDEASKKILLNRMESGIRVGLGMGLTLVKRILDRYGGKLILEDRVQGNYSEGACFKIYLPIIRTEG